MDELDKEENKSRPKMKTEQPQQRWLAARLHVGREQEGL
jgi:hypothetical protein